MARLRKNSKTEEDVKKMGVAAIRKEYIILAENYNRLLDHELVLCSGCGEYLARHNFYSADNAIGCFPICKSCIRFEVENKKKVTDEPNETKESIQRMLRKMDLPYIDELFRRIVDCEGPTRDGKPRGYVFGQLMTLIKSLPQYNGYTWLNSEFGSESSDDDSPTINDEITTRKPRSETVKLFGSGLSTADYLYLEDQFDDWRSRVQIDSKSQETYITRICFKLLEIHKAQISGKDTSALDKSLNELMSAANLQPKQNVSNASNDTLTFGQLIEKWEQEEPIPEPSPEFADVDNIGKYIRVWFKGHLARALGLDNGYSKEYDEYTKQYTVTKPEYGVGDYADEDIYTKVFGKDGE